MPGNTASRKTEKAKIAPVEIITIYTVDGPHPGRVNEKNIRLGSRKVEIDSYDKEALKSSVIETVKKSVPYREGRLGFAMDYNKAELLTCGSIDEYVKHADFVIRLYVIEHGTNAYRTNSCLVRNENSYRNYSLAWMTTHIKQLCNDAELKLYMKRNLGKHCKPENELLILNGKKYGCENLDFITENYGTILRDIMEHPLVKANKLKLTMSISSMLDNIIMEVDAAPKYQKSLDYNLCECLNLNNSNIETHRNNIVTEFNHIVQVITSADIVEKKIPFAEGARIIAEMPKIDC